MPGRRLAAAERRRLTYRKNLPPVKNAVGLTLTVMVVLSTVCNPAAVQAGTDQAWRGQCPVAHSVDWGSTWPSQGYGRDPIHAGAVCLQRGREEDLHGCGHGLTDVWKGLMRGEDRE